MIEKSESISNLLKALALAQSQIKIASKDAENPHFRSKYASFASVVEAARDALSKNGLCITQHPVSRDNKISLTTILGHSSGEWLSSTFDLLLDKPSMQSLGSGLTYAKRQAFAAILNVVSDDDDDGNMSEQAAVFQQQSSKPVHNYATGAPSVGGVSYRKEDKLVTEPQIKRLFAIQKKSGWSVQDLFRHLSDAFSLDDYSKLNQAQYDKLCSYVESNKPPSNESLTNEDIPF